MIKLYPLFRTNRSVVWLFVWLALIVMISANAEAREVRYLNTDLMESGQAISLEVVLFRPIGTGPFPLLVFNHGSTGRGTDPERIKQTFWTNAIANYFTDRGWLVTFPQRRGRGGSGGLYDEGFKEDRALGYSCQLERSLQGANRALGDIRAAIIALIKLPEVDGENIIIAGVSRGGALSVAYAGLHPDQVTGVINFVGGWMTNKCPDGPSINRSVFLKGAAYGRPMLWLYGRNDPNYATAHTRWLFETFIAKGGMGRYLVYDVPDTSGHMLYRHEPVWREALDRYLADISVKRDKPPSKRHVVDHKMVVTNHDDVPLPDDLLITPVDNDLPNERKLFSGLWEGATDENWHHVLVLESLDDTGAQTVFAFGINKSMGVDQGHWVRLDAVWDGPALFVLLSHGRKAVYRLRDNNRLEMKFFDASGAQTHHAWLTKSPSSP